MEAERPALPDTRKGCQPRRRQTLRSGQGHLLPGDQGNMSDKALGDPNVRSASQPVRNVVHIDGQVAADAPDPHYKVLVASRIRALGQSRKGQRGSVRSAREAAPEEAALRRQPAAEVSEVGSEAEAYKGVSSTGANPEHQRKEKFEERQLRERKAMPQQVKPASK